MDRRRIALIAAGVVLFGGVIVVLRTAGAGEPGTATTTSVPPPTSLAPFAAEGVLVPTAGEPPNAPAALRVTSGPRRLQVRWTGDAPGYEVRWGKEDFDHTRLVAQPVTQLDGLENETGYRVEVRAVDAFGRRSAPAQGSGAPHAGPEGEHALVDRFDQPNAPDPTRWRLASRTNCARATPGRDGDGNRLVISSACVASPTSLRSRTPFVLRDADELGRFIVETDAPGPDGELFLDLVPGPFSLVSGEALPPDAIRLRVATGNKETRAQVLVPEGTPTTVARAAPTMESGITHRWELVLRRDGTRVLLDGELVATSPAVPRWKEATALLSVAGPTGHRVTVSLVAFDGVKAATPPLVPPPNVRVVIAAEAAETDGTEAVPDVAGGQLRLTLLHTDSSPVAPEFTAVVNGVRVPLRPAAPGAPWRSGVGYPVVADLPVDALRVNDAHQLVAVVVTTLRVQASHVDLELTPTPGAPLAPPEETETMPLTGLELSLPRVAGTVLDAGGQPVPEGSPLRPGRLVFDVVLSGERETALAGLAGFSVRLDGDRVAAVPTNAEGPGVVGTYRLALNTGALSAGPHLIEVKLFGTSTDTRPTSVFVPFFIVR